MWGQPAGQILRALLAVVFLAPTTCIFAFASTAAPVTHQLSSTAAHRKKVASEVEWLMEATSDPSSMPSYEDLARVHEGRARTATAADAAGRRLQGGQPFNAEASSWASNPEGPNDIEHVWGLHLQGLVPDPEGGSLGTDSAGFTCSDPRAENDGSNEYCTYDCDTLKQFYFPEFASDPKTQCFVLTAANDWPPELLDLKQSESDMTAYVQSQSSAVVHWIVGDPGCTNVTLLLDSVHNQPLNQTAETLCLLDGQHEYNHANWTIASVTDADGNVHDTVEPSSTGESSAFTLGSCTDVYIKIETTGYGSYENTTSVSWKIDDGDHHGPWWINSTYAQMGNEHKWYTCLYDNNYTLTRVDAPGWQGTVSVVGWVEDNSIYIPQDERWIINGRTVNGVATVLDARIASGTPEHRTNASIILRHVRFSGQHGTLDPYVEKRGFSQRPSSRMGCAFMCGVSFPPFPLLLQGVTM